MEQIGKLKEKKSNNEQFQIMKITKLMQLKLEGDEDFPERKERLQKNILSPTIV